MKILSKLHLITFGCFLLACQSDTTQNPVNSSFLKEENLIWYEAPAEIWNEALPLGNGKLGVMVFGDPINERIQLNDDSMWPADDENWNEPAGNKNDLQQIRTLLFDGNNEEADRLFVEKFSRKSVVRSHQTLGDLFINLDHENITDYRRELDISNATATTSYLANGNAFTQTVFVSNPDNVIAIELTSAAPNGLSGQILLSRPEDEGHPTVRSFTTEDNMLIMDGKVTQYGGQFDSQPYPITEGVQFQTQLKIVHEGGTIERGSDVLKLSNVKKVTLLIVSNSSYYFDDYKLQNEKDLAAIGSKSFAEIQEDHVADYQSFYNRMHLSLGSTDLDTLSTGSRLERVQSGAIDIGLEALLYNFGRYLLISTSREGTNPANLQGLWNEHITAPWNADYHLNINLQMNYWLADMTGLGELNNPLFDYIDKLVENGKVTAQKNFGCQGTFIPHATDLWAPTWLRAPTAYWGCSVGAGGWLMQHYWQHYEFTGDQKFLRDRALPAIEEVAKFYSDWLIEDPRDGMLISAPSTSPENRFINQNGNPVATCLGSAMDQQVINEVFENYLKACDILDIDNDFTAKIKNQKAQLRPGFVIDENGRILEWDRPYEEHEPGHRHMSHLYGFHPGSSITQKNDPDMFEAIRKTLDYRLANGGAGTGWSRAWLINCSARLLDGEMAHEHVDLLLKKSTGPNLFNSHPPYQIDGNFGYVAGVSEMLLQSHEENTLRLLPALPSQWPNGDINGIRARGGLTLDISWRNNTLSKASISSDFDQKFDIIYQNKVVPVEMKAGETYVYEGD
ncbi:MAG: glycoside hydrolase family 95 protein [Cyclobacteriaceae bacterium]